MCGYPIFPGLRSAPVGAERVPLAHSTPSPHPTPLNLPAEKTIRSLWLSTFPAEEVHIVTLHPAYRRAFFMRTIRYDDCRKIRRIQKWRTIH